MLCVCLSRRELGAAEVKWDSCLIIEKCRGTPLCSKAMEGIDFYKREG